MIHCILFKGENRQYVTKPIAECLFQIARCMAKFGKEKQKVVHDDCSGFVTTKWESAGMGAISGIIFDADVHTMKGQVQVKFLVRTGELDGLDTAEWYTYRELKRLMQDRSQSYEWN